MRSILAASSVFAVALGVSVAVYATRIPQQPIAPAGVGQIGAAVAQVQAIMPQVVPAFQGGNQPPNKVVFGRNTNSIEWEPTPWANQPFGGTKWMPKGGRLDTAWLQYAYGAVNSP